MKTVYPGLKVMHSWDMAWQALATFVGEEKHALGGSHQPGCTSGEQGGVEGWMSHVCVLQVP